MKKSSIIVLLTVLMSMVSTKASAYDIAVMNSDGVFIYYKWSNNKTELTVTQYGNNIYYTGEVVIPESVEYRGETYPVTSIGVYAFKNCSELTSVTLPNCVTTIGESAFQGCSKLTSVILPNCVTTIGQSAFQGCRGLTSIVVPNSITSIGAGAFRDCSLLTVELHCKDVLAWFCGISSINNINIGDEVTSIGSGAFYNCSGLTSVTIGNGVTSIDDDAFADCNSLTSVNISDLSAWCKIDFNGSTSRATPNTNPLKYARRLFLNGSEVKDLVIPHGLTSISDRAFEGCSGLISVTIGNSVNTIGDDAFSGCSGLTSVNIGNSVNTIGDNAFSGCSGLTSVTIPSSVKSIDRYAFNGCSSLTSIIIPNSVTSIGGYTFMGCTSLTSVTIPNSVTSIQEYAFYGCSSLNSIFIPSSVTRIYSSAFANCSGLTSVTIPNSVTYISGYTFSGCSGLTSITIPSSVTSIGERAFYGSGLTSVTIPSSVTSIGERAFYGSGLTSVTISNSVTTIGESAFEETPWYNNYPDGLIYIGKIAYKYKGAMPSNTSIIIKDGTLGITGRAFENCSTLTSITIPNSVTTIGSNVFAGCTGLTSVSIPNNVKKIELNTFSGCTGLSSATIGNSVTSIGSSAFKGCTGLTSIIIPNSVISIGSSAFEGCTGLTSVTIGNSVTSIGDYTFRGCSGLTFITIPNSVTSIGNSAFQDCTAMISIIIPNSVTSIGYSAFYGCSGLTSITIPNSVTSIGSGAFSGCSGLITASISNNMTKIPAALFRDCTNLKTVYLGKSANEVDYPGGYKGGNPYGWNPFRGCNNLQNVIIGSDKFPHMIDYNYFTNIDNCRFIMKQSTYDSGIPNSDQKYIKYIATYSKQPMVIELKSKGATSAVFNLCPIDEDGYFDEDNMKTVRTTGLTPGEQLSWKLDEENYGILSDKANETVTLTVEEPTALSTMKARLLATAEEADDVEHFGFEWRRIDSSDLIKSKVVSSPLYNGTIVGTLNNLNPEVEYKYRPFYKSDSGEMFYGEWIGLFTGDADVFYEPEVYTKDAEDITKVSALLAGIWLEGTDDIEEKGFEYWTVSGSKTRAIGSDVKKVAVSGSSNAMTTTLEGLKSGATYGFRSYVKTTKGKMTYGEEKTFQTILIGDVDGDGKLTNADADAIAKHIIGQTPSGFNKKMADVNNDGDVNVIDIVLLVKMIE